MSHTQSYPEPYQTSKIERFGMALFIKALFNAGFTIFPSQGKEWPHYWYGLELTNFSHIITL